MDNRTVLIADDDDEHRYQLEEVAKQARYKVCGASSGEEAIGLLKEEKFFAVLTDARMETPDAGRKVLMSATSLQPDAHVIVITAHPDDFPEANARELGAYDYLDRRDAAYVAVDRLRDLLEEELPRRLGRAVGEVQLEAWVEAKSSEPPGALEVGRSRKLRVEVYADPSLSIAEQMAAKVPRSARRSSRPPAEQAPPPFEVMVFADGAVVEPSRARLLPKGPGRGTASVQVTAQVAGTVNIEVALLLRGEAVGRVEFHFPVRTRSE